MRYAHAGAVAAIVQRMKCADTRALFVHMMFCMRVLQAGAARGLADGVVAVCAGL